MSAEPMVAQHEPQPQEGIVIRQSPTLGKLAGALAAAQAKFQPIQKDRTANVESKKGEASSYSYAYADLADVLAAVRPALAENGLAIMQPIVWNGSPWLVTRLHHSSDEWIEGCYKLGEYERPQDFGSAITYARRYTLTALLGIAAEEDDDGQRAQTGQQRQKGQAMPTCGACKKADRVIVSKFAPGHYCLRCKNPMPLEPVIDRSVEPDEGPRPETLTEKSTAPKVAAPVAAAGREPGSDDEPATEAPGKARIPPQGSKAWEDPSALGAEVLRLVGGDLKSARELLKAIAGSGTAKGMKGDAVRAAWLALAAHAEFGIRK